MTNDSFDRALMDQMGQLPPVPGELDLCTPWHSAVGRILWGLALCTFRLEVFYLQYLLPLLGATLLYLGYRSSAGRTGGSTWAGSWRGYTCPSR